MFGFVLGFFLCVAGGVVQSLNFLQRVCTIRAICLNRDDQGQAPPGCPPPSHPAPTTPGLTLDNQPHVPVLRAGRVADQTGVPPCILQQRLVKVETAICSDGMLAARWELVRARKHQLGRRAPLRAS